MRLKMVFFPPHAKHSYFGSVEQTEQFWICEYNVYFDVPVIDYSSDIVMLMLMSVPRLGLAKPLKFLKYES